MKKMLGKKKETKSENPSSAFVKPDPPLYLKQWEKEGLTIVENDLGVLFERKVQYPYDYKHGSYMLGELFTAIDLWEEAQIDHPFKVSADETLIFFDTETTGLKGTGTHIFLLGLLKDNGTQFELTQYVLADPSNEPALLIESKFWQHAHTVISYNGKSFDWPQLEMRWTLNREHLPPLKAPRQIDLLHSSKRIWRDDLDGMKLTKVETEKLGFMRVDDIPGHLAPIIYFDAVKSGNAHSLMKVLKHNEWDLLSLITLYIHSTKLLIEQKHETSISSTNIGKWYGDLKYRSISKETLENVTNSFDQKEVANAHFYLAQHYKKDGEVELALKSFAIAAEFAHARMQEDAYLHQAILFEHKVKDFEKALQVTERGMERAFAQLDKRSPAFQNRMKKWEIRKERLRRKIISRVSANYDKD